MERLYRVTFDTQKDCRYITWGLFVTAKNQPEAKAKAKDLWHSDDNPHQRKRRQDRYLGLVWTEHPYMFHVTAARMTEEERQTEIEEFYVIDNKAATWAGRSSRRL